MSEFLPIARLFYLNFKCRKISVSLARLQSGQLACRLAPTLVLFFPAFYYNFLDLFLEKGT